MLAWIIWPSVLRRTVPFIPIKQCSCIINSLCHENIKYVKEYPWWKLNILSTFECWNKVWPCRSPGVALFLFVFTQQISSHLLKPHCITKNIQLNYIMLDCTSQHITLLQLKGKQHPTHFLIMYLLQTLATLLKTYTITHPKEDKRRRICNCLRIKWFKIWINIWSKDRNMAFTWQEKMHRISKSHNWIRCIHNYRHYYIWQSNRVYPIMGTMLLSYEMPKKMISLKLMVKQLYHWCHKCQCKDKHKTVLISYWKTSARKCDMQTDYLNL